MKDEFYRELYAKVENSPARSAWKRGVRLSALEMVKYLQENRLPAEEKALLDGAENWNEYSWSGSALIYDEDIARRYCTPSEYRKKRGGDLQPSSRETWLDVQTRALWQACRLVLRAAKQI